MVQNMRVSDVLDLLSGEPHDAMLADTKLMGLIQPPGANANTYMIGTFASKAVSRWLSVSTAALANSPPLFKLAAYAVNQAKIAMPLAIRYANSEDRSPKSMSLEESLSQVIDLLHEGGFRELATQWGNFLHSGVLEDASLEEMSLAPFAS